MQSALVFKTIYGGVSSIPLLSSILGIEHIINKNKIVTHLLRSIGIEQKNLPNSFVLGWGLKGNTGWLRNFASQHKLPYLSIEDGFLRSTDLGVLNSPPLSLVCDDLGVYYNAGGPSRLEQILNGRSDQIPDLPPLRNLKQRYADITIDPLDDPALLVRASGCISKIAQNRLSKYNSSPDVNLGETSRPRVLVVDQTAGDLSIEYGLADADTFKRMLECALSENPDAEILIKTHPDVIAGKKQGHFQFDALDKRARLISEDINPISLLEQVERVYVVSSQMGFEALMLNKPVTCFGAPFYAGWGVTDDRTAIPRRTKRRSVEQLFAAAYILYAHYVDPETGSKCEIERIIEHLALQRRMFHANSGEFHCFGFSLWKRGYIRDYLHSPWGRVHFHRFTRKLRRRPPTGNAQILVWGTRDSEELRAISESNGIPIWRMEDGFLRSVGLGSDFNTPASQVVDRQGIYFDPTRPSDLEEILSKTDFADGDLERAQWLRESILSSGLSKYNFSHQPPLETKARRGQRIILVPGQVEDDASIRLGCIDIRTNGELLQAVRNNNPDAYIIYKPHPDVLSGNREGRHAEEIRALFDQLVTDTPISECLELADEIHTMTSLVGFEGLLRIKRVVTYGLPFYAGWGLTEDRHRIERRGRHLTLDQLVAGTLIHYPRYFHPRSGAFSTPEATITQLSELLSRFLTPPGGASGVLQVPRKSRHNARRRQ
jgi:capsular polysaccharide export protein